MSRVYKPKPQNFQPAIMCGGKRCYQSKQEALIAAEEQGIINNVELKVYKCLTCHTFHLTRVKD